MYGVDVDADANVPCKPSCSVKPRASVFYFLLDGKLSISPSTTPRDDPITHEFNSSTSRTNLKMGKPLTGKVPRPAVEVTILKSTKKSNTLGSTANPG